MGKSQFSAYITFCASILNTIIFFFFLIWRHCLIFFIFFFLSFLSYHIFFSNKTNSLFGGVFEAEKIDHVDGEDGRHWSKNISWWSSSTIWPKPKNQDKGSGCGWQHDQPSTSPQTLAQSRHRKPCRRKWQGSRRRPLLRQEIRPHSHGPRHACHEWHWGIQIMPLTIIIFIIIEYESYIIIIFSGDFCPF